MSIQRPSRPPSSPYITPEGFEALQAEHKALWLRRRDVTAALTAAAAEGDRSENAEYLYRKKELRGIDRRIRYLQKRLPILKVVRERPTDPNKVFFGAYVTLEDKTGRELRYRIVGADEFDSKKGWISIDAPVARALLNKGVDEEIRVLGPEGEMRYCILDIRYS